VYEPIDPTDQALDKLTALTAFITPNPVQGPETFTHAPLLQRAKSGLRGWVVGEAAENSIKPTQPICPV
jgi:hypothetical protein